MDSRREISPRLEVSLHGLVDRGRVGRGGVGDQPLQGLVPISCPRVRAAAGWAIGSRPRLPDAGLGGVLELRRAARERPRRRARAGASPHARPRQAGVGRSCSRWPRRRGRFAGATPTAPRGPTRRLLPSAARAATSAPSGQSPVPRPRLGASGCRRTMRAPDGSSRVAWTAPVPERPPLDPGRREPRRPGTPRPRPRRTRARRPRASPAPRARRGAPGRWCLERRAGRARVGGVDAAASASAVRESGSLARATRGRSSPPANAATRPSAQARTRNAARAGVRAESGSQMHASAGLRLLRAKIFRRPAVRRRMGETEGWTCARLCGHERRGEWPRAWRPCRAGRADADRQRGGRADRRERRHVRGGPTRAGSRHTAPSAATRFEPSRSSGSG